jgi:hypothetical protein
LRRVDFDPAVAENVIERTVYSSAGDPVTRFAGGGTVVGTLILRFADMEEMLDKMDRMDQLVRVEVD